MAHYAVIDSNNIVTQVFVGRDEDDLAPGIDGWEEYYAPEGHTVKRTSYNTIGGVHYDASTGEASDDQSKAFRKNYAGIGFTYDAERDAFIPPKPFESWTLDEASCLWEAPVPMPEDGNAYSWNEATTSWELISEV